MKNTTETVLWAGSIMRYHNRPTAQKQTVGEHTWRVMVIYTEMYGMPRSPVYFYILHHDVAEIVTGDVPFIVKRRYPTVKKLLSELEDEINYNLFTSPPALTQQELYQIKVADLLEMLFFAIEDVNMGCQYSVDIIENILEALEHNGQAREYLESKGYQGAINRILSRGKDQDTRPDIR